MHLSMSKSVILTGIRSNEEPTLGNYLGAIAPIVKMANQKADDYQVNMFVPDLHSFTTPIDHKTLYQRTVRNIKLFVAAGLPYDHDSVYLYRQSYIPAHSELAWILSCFTGFGEASRMVEFKDKAERLGQGQVSVGLFNYPILMAADILLHKAEWIPVGDDQRQHIEITRDIAIRMNGKFGDLFVVPHDIKKQQAFIDRDGAPRIRSLKSPESKMSKSVSDPNGTILLSDKPDDAAKKVMSATTDSIGSISLDWQNQPGVSNLMQLSALLEERPLEEVAQEWHGRTSYGDLKSKVAEQVSGLLSDLQAKLSTVDEASLLAKLESDEAAVAEVANSTLHGVQKAVGLRPS